MSCEINPRYTQLGIKATTLGLTFTSHPMITTAIQLTNAVNLQRLSNEFVSKSDYHKSKFPVY